MTLSELVDSGTNRGYVWFEEVNQMLPADYGQVLDLALRAVKAANLEIREEDSNQTSPLTQLATLSEPLAIYIREVAKVPPLTRDVEIELFQRIRHSNGADEGAKRKIAESNLALVVALSKQRSSSDIEMLDVIQQGNLGLMKAVGWFDYSSGYQFPSYAKWWILVEITRLIKFPPKIPIPPHLAG